MYSFQHKSFTNLGYILCDIPTHIRRVLLDEIVNIQINDGDQTDYRPNLIGNITSEYKLVYSVDALSEFILTASEEYINTYNYFGPLDFFGEHRDLVLEDLWVNFQKKGDFNPIHDHRGMFSFVIWVQIPYELKDELNLYSKSAEPAASVFSFHYLDILGMMKVLPLPIDKSWEWKMVLFPSKLNHSVNPFFTSNELRISVAGNVCIKS